MSSQDIRSLLRAELSTRRITHPHASYATNKSNLLSCTVCHLIIKSEALWDGHLRSANHRRNVQRWQQGELGNGDGNGNGQVGKSAGGGGSGWSRKRKADDADADETAAAPPPSNSNGARKRKAEDVAEEEEEGADTGRKKTKSQQQQPASTSRVMSGFIAAAAAPETEGSRAVESKGMIEVSGTAMASRETVSVDNTPHPPEEPEPEPETPTAAPTINEEEWAAFEREVIPLTAPTTAQPPSAIITAAPLSAAEIAANRSRAEKEASRAMSREEEAEAEREEEGRRMEDEFEVQEEMERRVGRLRGRLEMLRSGKGAGVVRDGNRGVEDVDVGMGVTQKRERADGQDVRGDGGDDDDDDDESVDEFDDWGFA